VWATISGSATFTIGIWGAQAEIASGASSPGPYVSSSGGAASAAPAVTTLTTSDLSPGINLITGSYGGDNSYNASTSQGAPQTCGNNACAEVSTGNGILDAEERKLLVHSEDLICVCRYPTEEVCAIGGTNGPVVYYYHTVSDKKGTSFNGQFVKEAHDKAGHYQCGDEPFALWPSSKLPYPVYVTAEGNKVKVGSGGANQWGFDRIGNPSSLTQYIRDNVKSNGCPISPTLGFSLIGYQAMEMNCNTKDDFTPYIGEGKNADNYIIITVYSNGVEVCKQETASNGTEICQWLNQ
jgi:hypothetical protein